MFREFLRPELKTDEKIKVFSITSLPVFKTAVKTIGFFKLSVPKLKKKENHCFCFNNFASRNQKVPQGSSGRHPRGSSGFLRVPRAAMPRVFQGSSGLPGVPRGFPNLKSQLKSQISNLEARISNLKPQTSNLKV